VAKPILAAKKRGVGGEIQLTDAMIELTGKQPFCGLEFESRSFISSSKTGDAESAPFLPPLSRPKCRNYFRHGG